MKRIKLEEIRNSQGTTNWNALKKKTDADIEKEARLSDAKLLNTIELSEFRRDEGELGRNKER